jgi:SAM-dependent methyltransferase/FKBP-type peptidyl-prolyl cis-trans isomerase 2
MTNIDRDCFATLEFELLWSSDQARHKERYLARKVNIWRDVFPPGMEEALIGLGIGDEFQLDFEPGKAVPGWSRNDVRYLAHTEFRPSWRDPQAYGPKFGRFYPKGFLNNLIGIYPQNIYPFRIIEVDSQTFTADLNHPLAVYPLSVRVRVHNVAVKDGDVGGRCSVWMEGLADKGPGMQARWKGHPTDFELVEPLVRKDELQDSRFYDLARMVGHVDAQASEHLLSEYSRYLQPGMQVLDVMSSMQSHLPLGMDLDVTGLGMNMEELKANPALNRHVVHDLNAYPELPFTNAAFDLVVCSLSFEYVIRPQEFVAQIRRVLRPGGRVICSFSNRWFPPKVTKLWSTLHEFERLGLVLEILLRDQGYTGLETMTVRNWWRPTDDKYYGQLLSSDPVYVVSGTVRD